MRFALSTHWNASRHTRGETLIEEVLSLGFDQVELGYDLRMDLVPGVLQMVKDHAIAVGSLHNFCPVPVGAARGNPELYTFTDPDRRMRDYAVQHTERTIRFAAEVGAKVVVTHGGNADMDTLTRDLCALYERGESFGPLYEKIKLKLQVVREKQAARQIGWLYEGVERLVPVLRDTGVILALEITPSWEAIPTEVEVEALCRHFAGAPIRYWHDIGHGHIRHILGFINQERWLERLQPWMVGMHVHDVLPPARDHVMPPRGGVDFPRLKRFATKDILRVIEPSSQTPAEDIVAALPFLQQVWGEAAATQNEEKNHE